MRSYRPGTVPNSPGEVPGFLRRELASVQEAANRAERELELQELHAAPTKVRTGMIVLADGTDWNPGAGAGVYAYYGGAWNRLG